MVEMSILAASIGVFTSLAPPLKEVRLNSDEDTVKATRSAIGAGIIIALVSGTVGAYLAKKSSVMVVSLVVALTMSGVYEYNLRKM